MSTYTTTADEQIQREITGRNNEVAGEQFRAIPRNPTCVSIRILQNAWLQQRI